MKTGITFFLLLITASIFCQNKIYWTDRGDFTISRCNLDGSDRELIHDLEAGTAGESGQVMDIAFDLENSKMYWAEFFRIRRSDLNGDNLETLVAGLTRAFGIDLDLEKGKIYWIENQASKIQRSNLDGSDIEDLIDSPAPISIALDVENNKMYWTDSQGDNEKIFKANLDGSGKEAIVETNLLGRPFGIDLDLSNQKMYWTDDENGTISRANLDGSGIEILVKGLNKAIDVSLDIQNGKMYWIQTQENKISRSNLDGSEIEELITSNLSFPTGIALLNTTGTATNEVEGIELRIMPNPSGGNFNIESDEVIKWISVYSIDGKLVLEKGVNSQYSAIKVSGYPKGIYQLIIDFGNEVIKSEKIVIQ